MNDRVLVVGAGGIGGVVAAMLSEAGEDVVVLVRPGATAAALASTGLSFTDPGGTRVVPVRSTTSLDPSDRFDWIVLTTQPNDVEAACEQVAPHLVEGGAVLVLQNGLCEARVARLVGEEAVLGGVVAWGASVDAPGAVRRTSRGRFTLGRLDGAEDPRFERVARWLSVVAPVTTTTNLRGARWTKLSFNCAISTLGTIGGDRVGPLIRTSTVQRLALDILSECVDVAKADDVTLEPLSGWIALDRIALPPQVRAQAWHPAVLARRGLLLAVGTQIRNLRSSMLRALESGKEPAIDHLNGEVVATAGRLGLAVPVNVAATELVHALARGEAQPGMAALDALFRSTREG